MKKLIIWDFDGVIADTERMWVTTRLDILNQKLNLGWSLAQAEKYMGGKSDKDKSASLKEAGVFVDESFWKEAMEKDFAKMSKGLPMTKGVEDIFKLTQFDQCIATGGIYAKTKVKLEKSGAEKYFSERHVFTVDLVKHGKPSPDLFLLAAKTMGYTPENCFVIEDSVVGITAAKKAKMIPIAYIEHDSEQTIAEIKKMKIKNVFTNMAQLKSFLLKQL